MDGKFYGVFKFFPKKTLTIRRIFSVKGGGVFTKIPRSYAPDKRHHVTGHSVKILSRAPIVTDSKNFDEFSAIIKNFKCPG